MVSITGTVVGLNPSQVNRIGFGSMRGPANKEHDLTIGLMDPPVLARVSAASRLDRLPISRFHRQLMCLLAYVFFFELGDLNNFGLAAPELRLQWNLSIQSVGFITSAAFVGMFIGALSGGWFSDKLGRKKSLIVTTMWYSAFSLTNALAWNEAGLLITRFLTGVGLAAMTVVAITYISEMFPASKRGTYQGWSMVIGLFGIPVTALAARIFIPMTAYGWRLVFVWGGLGIFIILFASKIEESPRWYESKKRFAEADEVLDRIEVKVIAQSGKLPDIPRVAREEATVHPPGGLFSATYAKRSLMLIGVYVFQTLGIFGFMAWVPTLLASRGFPVSKALLLASLMYIGAPIGAVIAAIVSDRWERKYLIAIAALIIAGFGMLYGLSSEVLPITVFGFLVAMFLQVFAPLLYAYTPEIYPTSIRTSGSGIAYGAGRLANGFGPLLVAYLFTQFGYTSVFIYIAAVWILVAAIVTAFGPKTRGVSLA